MAKGTGTGLIHGGLAGAAALLALSLAVPLPEAPVAEVDQAEVAAPEVSPETVPAEVAAAEPVAPEAVASPEPAEAPAPEPVASPQAETLDLPFGSEFARGPDLAPPAPSIPDAPAGLGGLTEAPAVAAPTAEPEPVASAAPLQLPDPTAEDAPAIGGLLVPHAETAVQVIGMQPMTAPELPGAPAGLAAPATDESGPDDSPVLAAPAPELAEPEPVAPAPEPEPTPASETPTPAQPQAPSLDLSTPPDLTDLRALERN